MGLEQINLIFGWSAYLSAAVTIATAITGILFFTLGERFGKLNDAVSVLQMLLLLPVSGGFFLLLRHNDVGLAILATVFGVLGMLVAAALQTLLVFDVVKYEQVITATLVAGGFIGLWLMLANGLALGSSILPAGLALIGIVGGVGYILLALGFYMGGHEHPFSYIGAVLVLAGYSIWSIWLGWLFTTGRLVL